MNEAHEGSCRQAPIMYTSHAAIPPSPFIPSLPHQPVVSSIHLHSHTQVQPARGTHFKPNPSQMQPHSKSRVATVNAARISCKVDWGLLCITGSSPWARFHNGCRLKAGSSTPTTTPSAPRLPASARERLILAFTGVRAVQLDMPKCCSNKPSKELMGRSDIHGRQHVSTRSFLVALRVSAT